MNIVILLYLIGFLIVLLCLLFRIGYIFLPKVNILINNVIYKLDNKNNLLYVKCIIEYIIDNNKMQKKITVVLKQNDFFKKDKLISDLKHLNGKFINYHYIPGFKRYGYVDCQLLLIPLWVYFISLVIMSLPIFIIFYISNS